MLEDAKLCFTKSEQDHLHCLIRVTLEFDDYLRKKSSLFSDMVKDFDGRNHMIFDEPETQYAVRSIFSGLDSFCSVNAAYQVLSNTIESRIGLESISTISLKDNFIFMFNKFTKEAKCEVKCRLLLDLFKLQIIFAAAVYK